jgi:hypothetical protein
MNVEWSSFVLFYGIIPEFNWRDWGKPYKFWSLRRYSNRKLAERQTVIDNHYSATLNDADCHGINSVDCYHCLHDKDNSDQTPNDYRIYTRHGCYQIRSWKPTTFFLDLWHCGANIVKSKTPGFSCQTDLDIIHCVGVWQSALVLTAASERSLTLMHQRFPPQISILLCSRCFCI